MFNKINQLFIQKKYKELINCDENNNFKIIYFDNYKHIDYNTYLIINELYYHKGRNVIYYKKYIHNQLFYDERNPFIIKRKTIFQELQKFNLSITKIKHILMMRYKKSKNICNLYGENFKKNHIELIENESKFKFDYFEIYNIVDSSFKQIYDGSPVILNVKNPYTNKNFSYFNVVNIYFLLMSYERIPKYFYLYFQNNFSKNKIYNQYHLNIFIDMMRYLYIQFPPETKIVYIDKMLEFHMYCSVIRKSQKFKLEHFEHIGLKFYTALKMLNHYGNEYYGEYLKLVGECQTKLIQLRLDNQLTTSYRVRIE